MMCCIVSLYEIKVNNSWSWSIKLVQFHTGDGLTGDQNDTN